MQYIVPFKLFSVSNLPIIGLMKGSPSLDAKSLRTTNQIAEEFRRDC
jgi:hypothetical protein